MMAKLVAVLARREEAKSRWRCLVLVKVNGEEGRRAGEGLTWWRMLRGGGALL
jgi:hypothetical protein